MQNSSQSAWPYLLFFTKCLANELAHSESCRRRHTADGEIRIKGTLQDAEQTLPPSLFFRCSRCYLVNLEKITGMQQQSVIVGNQVIQVSRSKWKELVSAVNDYWGGAI